MVEHRRKSAYSHSSSQKVRDDREPQPETPIATLRRRHIEERNELGEKHHSEAKEASLRSQHIDPKVSERERGEMNVRHGNERARLASRHEQELKRHLDADEEKRRAARR